MRNLTTEEFIERARKVHGDKYDYSKAEYVNSSTKVCIIQSLFLVKTYPTKIIIGTKRMAIMFHQNI